MLILFHYLSYLIYQLLNHRKRIKYLALLQESREKSLPEESEVDLEYNLTFDPPVFRQRYARVYETLLDERWRTEIKKICDFGCAEFGLFIFLKCLSNVNHMFFIDIDEESLRNNVRRVHPLTIEYLNRRNEPLEVNVFAGNVADPDYRLQDTDVVVAVELIEHLYPDALEAVPYNIFNFIEPKLVIITTPNSDFNILFSTNLKRMRHHDHKFEWSRAQFEEWAINIVTRFPDYTVSFSGIGKGPENTEHLGECSQMAVFIKKELIDDSFVSKSSSTRCSCDSSSLCKSLTVSSKMSCSCVCALCTPYSSYGICTYCSYSQQFIDKIQENEEVNHSYGIFYKSIEKIDYPYERDDRTEEEKMIAEFRYRISNFGHVRSRFFVEERCRSEIPLRDLLYGFDSVSITESELSKLLFKHDYKIEECIIQETGLLETCVIYEPEMEEISSSSEASGYDTDYSMYQPNDESLSDWDEPCVQNESQDNYESSTEPASSELTPYENQLQVSTVEKPQKNVSDSQIDSGYQKSSCVDSEEAEDPLKMTNSSMQAQETSASSLSDTEVNSNKSNKKDLPSIRPGRTFLNNFLNPLSESLKGPPVVQDAPQCSNNTTKNVKKITTNAKKSTNRRDVVEISDNRAAKSDEENVINSGIESKSNTPVSSFCDITEESSSSKVTPAENKSAISRKTQQRQIKLPDPSNDPNLRKSSFKSPPPPSDDLEESDVFEEARSTPNLSSEDNKVYLKKMLDLERKTNAPMPPSSDLKKPKIDINRINELDKFQNMLPPGRMVFNHFVNPQPQSFRKGLSREWDCQPGPSKTPSKKNKKYKKTGSFTDIADDSPIDDIKSITNCIVENTLNKLDIQEVENTKDDVIEFNIEPESRADPVVLQELDVVVVVENVVNNVENNEEIIEEINVTSSTINENFELSEETFPVKPENEVYDDFANLQVAEDVCLVFEEQSNNENAEQLECQVARASREVLFDPDSVQDLLEDFEIPPPMQEAVDFLDLGNGVVLIEIQALPSNIGQQEPSAENGFPQWLLQILGTQVAAEGSINSTSSEEPHFFCQGDGLGVHPSVVAVEVEEEDEDTTDSSNNTTDYAEVEQGLSSQDMSSLPEDSQANADGQDLLEEADDGGPRNETSEQTEYFDSVSSSSDGGK